MQAAWISSEPLHRVILCSASQSVIHHTIHTQQEKGSEKIAFLCYTLIHIMLYNIIKATTFVAHKRAELQKDKKSSMPPPPYNNIYIYKHIILCIDTRKSHLSLYRRRRRRSSLVLSETVYIRIKYIYISRCVWVYNYIYIHKSICWKSARLLYTSPEVFPSGLRPRRLVAMRRLREWERKKRFNTQNARTSTSYTPTRAPVYLHTVRHVI